MINGDFAVEELKIEIEAIEAATDGVTVVNIYLNHYQLELNSVYPEALPIIF